MMKNRMQTTAEVVLGKRRQINRKQWITADLVQKIEERRILKYKKYSRSTNTVHGSQKRNKQRNYKSKRSLLGRKI